MQIQILKFNDLFIHSKLILNQVRCLGAGAMLLPDLFSLNANQIDIRIKVGSVHLQLHLIIPCQSG